MILVIVEGKGLMCLMMYETIIAECDGGPVRMEHDSV